MILSYLIFFMLAVSFVRWLFSDKANSVTPPKKENNISNNDSYSSLSSTSLSSNNTYNNYSEERYYSAEFEDDSEEWDDEFEDDDDFEDDYDFEGDYEFEDDDDFEDDYDHDDFEEEDDFEDDGRTYVVPNKISVPTPKLRVSVVDGEYRIFENYIINGKEYTLGFPKSNCIDQRVWVGVGQEEIERISYKEALIRIGKLNSGANSIS